MLRANFQLLIPILTILLHLCCSWPPPRLAHDSTFMSYVQFYESASRKLQCYIKDLHKSRLLHTIIRVHSILRSSTSSITKCCRLCGKCTKVMLATVGNATFPANAVTSIDIHHICDNTKETASGFAKRDIPCASFSSILHWLPFTACTPPDRGPRPVQFLSRTP